MGVDVAILCSGESFQRFAERPGDHELFIGVNRMAADFACDWWVFGDGQLGAASVEVSGRRANTPWDSVGVRALLEAELSAVHRSRPVDVSAPISEPVAASSDVPSEASRSTAAEAALESAAP